MSDFIKNIVDEVIIRGKSVLEVNESSLEQMKRPNYQQMRRKNGMILYDLPHTQRISETDKKEEISELATLYATVGKKSMATENNSENSFIESSNCFSYIALGKERRIKQLLGFPYGNYEHGCVGYMEKCNLEQLFVLDKLLEENPGTDFQIEWGIDPMIPFSLCVVGNEGAMKAITEGMNAIKLCYRGICIREQTGKFLQGKLNLPSRAVATVEGVAYPQLLPALAEFLNQHSDSLIEAKTVGRYLLLSGEVHEVKEAIENIYRF